MLDQDEVLKELYINSHNLMVEMSEKNQEKMEEIENYHQVTPHFACFFTRNSARVFLPIDHKH